MIRGSVKKWVEKTRKGPYSRKRRNKGRGGRYRGNPLRASRVKGGEKESFLGGGSSEKGCHHNVLDYKQKKTLWR